MSNPGFRIIGLGVFLIAASFVLPEAWQQQPSPSSAERAQDQPFLPGSPFALLPGFKIDRVTPVDKTESYIVADRVTDNGVRDVTAYVMGAGK